MKIHIKAIILGFVTDISLSFIGSLLLMIPFGTTNENPIVYVGSLIFGLAATAVGGYVTSLKSPDSKTGNAAIFGALGVALGFLIASFISVPMWFNVASAILVIPAALFGAYIEMRKK